MAALRDLTEHHSKNRGKKAKTKVGFYGCSNRVVRLQATNDWPRKARVVCPACGHEHDVHPAWRTPTRLDKGREPDLTL